MRYRNCFLLVFGAAVVCGVSAQDAPEPLHWISLEASLIGNGVRYERQLSGRLSVGGTAFYHIFYLIWTSMGITASVRFYPWAGAFYAELGLGYGLVFGTDGGLAGLEIYMTHGVMITPALGWRIDLGKRGRFYINPMVSLPIALGDKERWYGETSFGVGVNCRPAFGIGYAF
jgi:hypothetical protein